MKSKLQRQFRLINDKEALDVIGLYSDGAAKRIMYWGSISKLVASGGLQSIYKLAICEQIMLDISRIVEIYKIKIILVFM